MESLLFTGGTGFLGANVKPILDRRYNVTTIGITDRDMLKANFAKETPVLPVHYDIVLHAAGKAHVYPKTEAERQAFFDINYTGTIHLCEALEKVGVPRAFIFISTAAVYGEELAENIPESAPLVGKTPYALSKLKAEEYLSEWCGKNGVKLGILRPSLLVGPNAPGNLGAMVKGIQKGYYFNIAGGEAHKSFLMAVDIGNIVPLIVEKGGVFNVCDTRQPTYGEISASVARQLGKGKPLSIPYWLANCVAKIGDIVGGKFPLDSNKLHKMVTSSTLSNEKIKHELGWEPLDVLDNYKIK